MKLWISGSKNWDDHMALARAITVLIQDMSSDDKDIFFYHLDRPGAEECAGSYIAKTKGFLTGKGFKVNEFIPPRKMPVMDRINKIISNEPDYLVLFISDRDPSIESTKAVATLNGISVIEHKQYLTV